MNCPGYFFRIIAIKKGAVKDAKHTDKLEFEAPMAQLTIDSGQWTVVVFPSEMIEIVGGADTLTVNCPLLEFEAPLQIPIYCSGGKEGARFRAPSWYYAR